MALLVRSNGSTRGLKHRKQTLKDLQGMVGGYIEVVPVRTLGFHYAVVNEEGLILGLPYNREASELAGRSLVGDVVFCTVDEID